MKVYFRRETIRKYYKCSETATLINADGVVTSQAGGNGWVIYPIGGYGEVYLMLNSAIDPTYPRWQNGEPNVYAYFKTPQKGIISSYLTTQWCDGSETSRICNHWQLVGYDNEQDMKLLQNGTLLDDNTWASISKGTSKTITLENNKPFQYYTLWMYTRFGGGSSWTSIGNTKFYMRLPEEATEDNYDFYEDVEVFRVPKINGKYYVSRQGRDY